MTKNRTTITAAARRKIAKDRLPREQFALATQQRIIDRGLTRAEAALIVRDAASQLSRLMSGHVHEFSADRLTGMILDLGGSVTVTIDIGSASKKRGKVKVRVIGGGK